MRTFIILLICLGLTSCEKDKREYPRTIETDAWEDVKIEVSRLHEKRDSINSEPILGIFRWGMTVEELHSALITNNVSDCFSPHKRTGSSITIGNASFPSTIGYSFNKEQKLRGIEISFYDNNIEEVVEQLTSILGDKYLLISESPGTYRRHYLWYIGNTEFHAYNNEKNLKKWSASLHITCLDPLQIEVNLPVNIIDFYKERYGQFQRATGQKEMDTDVEGLSYDGKDFYKYKKKISENDAEELLNYKTSRYYTEVHPDNLYLKDEVPSWAEDYRQKLYETRKFPFYPFLWTFIISACFVVFLSNKRTIKSYYYRLYDGPTDRDLLFKRLQKVYIAKVIICAVSVLIATIPLIDKAISAWIYGSQEIYYIHSSILGVLYGHEKSADHCISLCYISLIVFTLAGALHLIFSQKLAEKDLSYALINIEETNKLLHGEHGEADTIICLKDKDLKTAIISFPETKELYVQGKFISIYGSNYSYFKASNNVYIDNSEQFQNLGRWDWVDICISTFSNSFNFPGVKPDLALKIWTLINSIKDQIESEREAERIDRIAAILAQRLTNNYIDEDEGYEEEDEELDDEEYDEEYDEDEEYDYYDDEDDEDEDDEEDDELYDDDDELDDDDDDELEDDDDDEDSRDWDVSVFDTDRFRKRGSANWVDWEDVSTGSYDGDGFEHPQFDDDGEW